jgi:hypothetical protein
VQQFAWFVVPLDGNGAAAIISRSWLGLCFSLAGCDDENAQRAGDLKSLLSCYGCASSFIDSDQIGMQFQPQDQRGLLAFLQAPVAPDRLK